MGLAMEAQHAEGVRRAAADREAGSESREGRHRDFPSRATSVPGSARTR